jgi:hypothetical protein
VEVGNGSFFWLLTMARSLLHVALPGTTRTRPHRILARAALRFTIESLEFQICLREGEWMEHVDYLVESTGAVQASGARAPEADGQQAEELPPSHRPKPGPGPGLAGKLM